MPLIQDPIYTTQEVNAPQPKEAPLPTWDEIIQSSFRQNNDLYNMFNSGTALQTPDPEFDLGNALRKRPDLLLDNQLKFSDVVNQAMFDERLQKIEQERKDQETRAQAGWAGFATDVAAGMISPTAFMPFIGQAKGILAVAKGAVMGAAAGGVQEAILQETQVARDDNMLGTLGAGMVLGGVLGGIAGNLGRQVAPRVQRDMAIGSTVEAIPAPHTPSAFDSTDVSGGLATHAATINPQVLNDAHMADVDPVRLDEVFRQVTANYETNYPEAFEPMRAAETRLSAAEARIDELEAAYVPPEEITQQIAERARQMDPKLFSDWDALHLEADGLREFADYAGDPAANPRAIEQQNLIDKLTEKLGEFQVKAEMETGKRAAAARRQAKEIQEALDELVKLPVGLADQQVDVLRQLQINDFKKRDMLIEVNQAMAAAKRAQGETPTDVELIAAKKELEQARAEHAQAVFDMTHYIQGDPDYLKAIEDMQAAAIRQPRTLEEVKAVMAQVPEEVKQAATGNPTSAGAASAVAPGAGKLKSIGKVFGYDLNESLNWFSPVTRQIGNTRLPHASWMMAQLSTAGLKLEENAAGVASAKGGTVEARITQYSRHIYDMMNTIDAGYLEYAKGKPGVLGVFRAELGRGDKLKFTPFKEEIGNALREGANYQGDPVIAATAAKIRKQLYDPIFEEAQRVGYFSNYKGVVGDEEYLNRVYRNEVIERRKPEFVAILARHYEDQVNMDLRKAVATLQEQKLMNTEFREMLMGDANTVEALRGKYEAEMEELMKDPMARLARDIQETQKAARATPEDQLITEIIDGKGTLVKYAKRSEMKAYTKKLRDQGGKELSSWRVKRRNAATRLRNLDRAIKAQKDGTYIDKVSEVDAKMTRQWQNTYERIHKLGGDDIDLDAGTASFTEASKQRALDTTNMILGTYNRLPAREILQGERGPELARVLNIPSSQIREFLENDIELLGKAYVHTLGPDIEMTARFGSPDASESFRRLDEQALAAQEATTNQKERDAIASSYAQARTDLTAVIGKLRRTYGIPTNPAGASARLAHAAMALNTARFMGSVLISSIPDMGRIVMKHGLVNTFRNAFIPMISDFKTFKMSAEEAKLAGTALDIVLHSRRYAMSDMFDQYGRGTVAERGLNALANKMGVIGGFDYWTAGLKQFSAVLTNAELCNALESVTKGVGDVAKNTEYLAALGIDGDYAFRMMQALEDGGGSKINDVWLPNTDDWSDLEMQRAYRAALSQNVDNTIITPGVERPNWMSSSSLSYKLIGQFKSFGASSVNKTLRAGLQERDMAVMNGAMISLAFGALSYYIRAQIIGGQFKEDMENAPLAKWADEAIYASGLLGSISDVQGIASNIPLTANVATFSGREVTARMGQNLVGQALGPTADLVSRVQDVVVGADAPTQRTLDSALKLSPLHNVFYLRSGFDALEEAIGQYLPKSRKVE